MIVAVGVAASVVHERGHINKHCGFGCSEWVANLPVSQSPHGIMCPGLLFESFCLGRGCTQQWPCLDFWCNTVKFRVVSRLLTATLVSPRPHIVDYFEHVNLVLNELTINPILIYLLASIPGQESTSVMLVFSRAMRLEISKLNRVESYLQFLRYLTTRY